MTRKPLPIEAIVGLYQQIAELSAKHPDRKRLMLDTAAVFNVSLSTVRRAIKNYHRPHFIQRADYNKPRKISAAEMVHYCELIAALKMRSCNRKGKQLSTSRAIWILEDHGVKLNDKHVISPKGLLTKPTVNRYLSRLKLSSSNFRCEPIVVHFEAKQSNECWQLDFTPSDLKYLPQDN